MDTQNVAIFEGELKIAEAQGDYDSPHIRLGEDLFSALLQNAAPVLIVRITTVTLTMTEPEARAFLVDAAPLQDQVREALAQTHRLNGGVATISVKPKLSPRAGVKKHPLTRTKKSSTTDTHVCIECGKEFKTRGRYDNHLRDNHPKTIPASPDEFVHAAD